MIWFELLVALIVIGCVVGGYFIWDRRYRGRDSGEFVPTQEVFRDPSSGRLTRVWEDPRSGRRQYREED